MQIKADTIKEYMAQLPDDRKPVMEKMYTTIKNNLPHGFEADISYGMISFNVPHSLYPAGYHCNPAQPLPFISIASQKNFIAIYHMGIYADKKLLEWFVGEYHKHTNAKLDMGKSCIRFKKPETIPYDLIAKLSMKITPQQWINLYQNQLQKN